MQSITRGGFWLLILCVFLLVELSPLSAAAQVGGAAPMLEKPQPTSELPGPGEQKEETPTTCGPLISDSCIPIEEHHASVQVLGAYSFVVNNFSLSWRRVSAGGNFSTFQLPVKFTYGPTKNLETYIIAPFLANFANSVHHSRPQW